MSKRITVYPEDVDDELLAMQRFIEWAKFTTFESRWRVLSYLCVRYLGEDWALAKRAK